MIKRIAKETTIHGIKEAVYANHIGRIFFAFVFVTCYVLMSFQLKDIFRDYFNDNVGTTLSDPTADEDLEVPSVYYCNNLWFPNVLGLKELSRTGHGFPRNMYEQMGALHSGFLQRNDTMYPLDNLWWLMRMQDVINGITLLPDERRFNLPAVAAQRPRKGSVVFYDNAHHEMTKMLKSLIGSSLRSAVKNKLGESMTREDFTQTDQTNKTHGIFPNDFHASGLSATQKLFSELSDRNGNLTLSLDGICWEFLPRPWHFKLERNMGGVRRHVVTHFGGLGRHFSKLMHLYLTTPGGTEFRTGDTLESALDRVVIEVMRYSMFYTNIYGTHVSIATQGGPHLLFEQKIHIDLWTPRVLLKYWKKRYVLKSRKGSPCRADAWTELDQAHCNQHDARKRGGSLCEQYLPQSKHFEETPITNKTCIYDHTGIFEFGISAVRSQSIGLSSGFPLQISSASRRHVLLNLTTNSGDCPRPCSKTMFQFDATYPTSDISRGLSQCYYALAYSLVPPDDLSAIWLGKHKITFPQPRFTVRSLRRMIFRIAFQRIRDNPYRSMFSQKFRHRNQWPCSVVEFARSDTHGQISEEYFLYSLSDLAASMGGTTGLWFGASVISIVQLLYLCCFKRLFKRAQRDWFKCRTRCVGRLRAALGGRRVKATATETTASRV